MDVVMSRSRTPCSEASDLISNSQFSEYGHIDDISPILALEALEAAAQDGDGFTSTQEDVDDDEGEFKIKKRKQSDISDTSTLVDEPDHKRVKTDPDYREPYLIASSTAVEERMRKEETPSGVQLEIARLYSSRKIDIKDITVQRLRNLKGTSAHSAPRTASVFQPTADLETRAPDPAFARENAATSPWEELDKEETNLAKDQYAGLGHSDLTPGWYGGKVSFSGKLRNIKACSKHDAPDFTIVLDRCSLGPSSRFTRRFGSTSVLRIRIDGDNLFSSDNTPLLNFFKRPLILWGRVYRSFFAKEGSVFLLRTNEGYVNGDVRPAMYPGFSYLEFMRWHNPLETNKKQGMPKWSARMALGLSNSFPGPLLAAENILDTPDIIAPNTDENAPGRDMTDGCGFSNRSTHSQVHLMLSSESHPTAFQYRLAGIKGMSSERSDLPFTEPPKIWVRPSQIKIRYPPNHHPPEEPTLRIIELVRTSHMKTPARLSAELIINLAENGVPGTCFRHLLKTQLREIIDKLTSWKEPNAMYNLWVTVERIGAVLFARRAREAAGEARAKGFGEQHDDDGRDDEDDDDDELLLKTTLGQRSTAWWPDYVSGSPSSLEETVLSLLDAGFSPETSPILRDKLKQITKSRIMNTAQKVNWDLPHSATAFVIPDEYGVLEEDEVQIKSSRRNLLLPGPDQLLGDTVLGDVLLSRNPCKLPTDVRKVKAVEHPALRDCVDVIVCSVKGHRRLLDFLAGGDYDGDKAMAIWTPEFVKNFKNANEHHSIEPLGVAACFTSKDNISAGDFAKRIAGLSDRAAIAEYQRYLLGALRNPATIGTCSKMHDSAVYKHGYAHVKAIKLAHIFCKVLDGGKSGLEFLEHSYKQHKKDYLEPDLGPAWKQPWSPEEASGSNQPKLAHPSNKSFVGPDFRKTHGMPLFIMDELHHYAKRYGKDSIKELKELFKDFVWPNIADADLCKPFTEAKRKIKSSSASKAIQEAQDRDMLKIQAHVERIFKIHKDRIDHAFTNKPIEVRQDLLRALSTEFASFPSLADMETILDEASIARIRASYAYVLDLSEKHNGRGWSRFPWNVAFRELCHIKASALGPYKTTTIGFYERFKIAKGR